MTIFLGRQVNQGETGDGSVSPFASERRHRTVPCLPLSPPEPSPDWPDWRLLQDLFPAIKDCEDSRAQRPGKGIDPVGYGNVVDKQAGDGEHEDPDNAPGQEHDHHGGCGPSRSAEGGPHHMGISNKREEGPDNARSSRPEGDHVGRAVKERDQLRSEQTEEQTDDGCNDRGTGDAEPGAGTGAVRFLRTEILTDKGRQRHGKASDRKKGEAFDFLIASDAGDGGGAEAVDIGLNEHIGKGDNRILQAGREPDLQNSLYHFFVQPDFTEGQVQRPAQTMQPAQGQQHADKLGNAGGKRRSADAKVHPGYKQKIQHHVEHG